MFLYHIVILAIIQGLTEFLPVSSSGHLVVTHSLLGHQESLEAIDMRLLDMAVHVGTLFSVLIYFRQDIWNMLKGLFNITKDPTNTGLKTIFKITIGSIPVIIAGFILHKLNPSWLQAVEVIAWTTIIFGVLLWVADRFFKNHKHFEDLSYFECFLIGLGQCLALIPGVSRSGITMTFGRFLGMKADEAARYSLLLALVAISGAGFLGSLDLIEQGNIALTQGVLLSVILSFLSGWAAIAVMMAWLKRSGFTPFVIYRIALGMALLAGIHFGVIA